MKLNDFKLERYFAKYEFNTPYLMCSSDCESFSVKELLDLEPNARDKMEELHLGYTESTGAPELRETITSLYENITAEQLLVFAGAQEGILAFMNVLVGKGDSIIVQSPCYQSLYEIADGLECRTLQWQMKHNDKKWLLDLDLLEASIDKTTRAIVINSPHNPTGFHLSAGQLNDIVDIARAKDIYLFSDEVYRFLEYDEKNRLPAVCDIYEKGVSLGVMSKAFGLAGLRIGWIGTQDKELLKKAAAFKDYTTICSSAPSEFLSTLALRHKDKIINRNLSIIKENLSLLDPFFQRHEKTFQWLRPKAGPIAFPCLRQGSGVTDSHAFCLDLIEKKGVLLLPGDLYNWDAAGYFRIGFGRRNFAEGLNLLDEYLR